MNEFSRSSEPSVEPAEPTPENRDDFLGSWKNLVNRQAELNLAGHEAPPNKNESKLKGANKYWRQFTKYLFSRSERSPSTEAQSEKRAEAPAADKSGYKGELIINHNQPEQEEPSPEPEPEKKAEKPSRIERKKMPVKEQAPRTYEQEPGVRKGIQAERFYESQHEIKDDAAATYDSEEQIADSVGTILSRMQDEGADVFEVLKDRTRDDRSSRQPGITKIVASTPVYQRAVKAGFWAGILVFVLLALLFLQQS